MLICKNVEKNSVACVVLICKCLEYYVIYKSLKSVSSDDILQPPEEKLDLLLRMMEKIMI